MGSEGLPSMTTKLPFSKGSSSLLGLTFILSRVGWRLETWMPLIVAYNIKVSFFLMIGLVFSGITLGISWVLARIFA